MAKKKSTAPRKPKFNPSPFSDLKGLSVSVKAPEEAQKVIPQEGVEGSATSFADEMALLGVARLDSGSGEELEVPEVAARSEQESRVAALSDEEQFLRAMGELKVDFSDQLPLEDSPPAASASRMRQLRRGRLSPEATLDLHGLTQSEVSAKLQFFLDNAVHQGWRTLLVITGRGLHSIGGEAVLRGEAERYLATEGLRWVAEWGRAPKQYGGGGALVLFLRKNIR